MDKDACKKKDDDFKRTNAIRYDELKALKELLDNDIITKEEFEIKKKRVFRNIKRMSKFILYYIV